jgi:hypothetical protein
MFMKRWLSVLMLLVGAIVFAAPSFGDDGGGKREDRDKNASQARHVVIVVSNKVVRPLQAQIRMTDTGTCGNAWATVTARRQIEINRRAQRVFRLELQDRGTFTTIAGKSPAACASSATATGSSIQSHGQAVNAGHTGTFRSQITMTVRNARLNRTAKLSLNGNLRAFVTAVFGPNATFSCAAVTGASTAGACTQTSTFRAAAKVQANTTLGFSEFQRKVERAQSKLTTELTGDIAEKA